MELIYMNENAYDNLEDRRPGDHVYSTQTADENFHTTSNTDTDDSSKVVTDNVKATRAVRQPLGKCRLIGVTAVVAVFISVAMCLITRYVVYYVINEKASIPIAQSGKGEEVSKSGDRSVDGEVVSKSGNQSVDGEEGLETDGWELIFRGTSGNGYNVYDAWKTGKDTTDVKPTNMKRGLSRHYRNTSRVNDWRNVNMVKYALYKNEEQVAYIVFNGSGSTNMNWFNKNRVLDSSWTAVKNKDGIYSRFSIVGHENYARRFLVRIYSKRPGCEWDLGYLFVHDTDSKERCPYEELKYPPIFVYSKRNAPEVFQLLLFGRADYMAIFYKTL